LNFDKAIGLKINIGLKIIMNEIIMVYPELGAYGTVIVDLPLSLIYAARVAHKEGYKIKIIDCRVEDDWENKLLKELKNNPLAVTISCMTGKPIYHALKVSKLVKENSNVPVIWGGIHPTLLPIQTLEHPLIDCVVEGDGEFTLYEIAKALEKGKSFHGIAGTYFKENGKVIKNPKRPPTNPNSLPSEIPPYELVDIKKYKRVGFKETSFSILTSRGCPHRCAFCHVPATDNKWLSENVDRTINHIKYITENFKPDYLFFNDNDFFVDLKRAESIFLEMKKEKIDVIVGFRGMRVSELNRLDDNFLRLMEDIGARELHIGAESGSQKILDLIKKGINVEDTINVNKKLSKYSGLRPSYNFFTGVPGETEEDIFSTTNLILNLLKENKYAQISSICQFNPYPGTELYELAVKYGYQPPKKLEDWIETDQSDYAKKCPWITPDRRKLMDMLYLAALFVDKKIEWHFLSNKPQFFLLRNISKMYRPIARFRMKNHIYSLPIEVSLKNFIFNHIEKKL